MKQAATMRQLTIAERGQLVVPFAEDDQFEYPPVNGSIRASKTKGYGEIYINGRWVLFGQDSMPLLPVRSSAYTQTGSAFVPVDSSGGSFTIELDSLSIPGDRVVLINHEKSWYKNPITISSLHDIEGSSSNLVVNSEDGAIELFFINDTEGWVVIDGSYEADESGFLDTINITSNTNAKPRHEYVIAADGNIALKLPTDAPIGSQIRLVDGAGAGDDRKVVVTADTAIVNGNKTSHELGNNYGSITFQCYLVGGVKRWLIVNENSNNTPITRSELTSSITVGYREDTYYPVNTTAGDITVTLPSDPRPGQVLTFTDSRGTWHENHLVINFGAKGCLALPSGITCIRKFGFAICIFNEATQKWDFISSEFESDVTNWETKTTSFTAKPDYGYRVAPATSMTVTLPDPNSLNNDEVIRIVNVSSDSQADDNLVEVTGPRLLDGNMLMCGREAWEFRIMENGSTAYWYLAASNESESHYKRKTTAFTAYGKFNYRCDFSTDVTITLDTSYSRIGQRCTFVDVDGGWAGRTIKFQPQSGTIDAWGSRTFHKGYARLEFERTPDGWSLISENYADRRDISSPNLTPKPFDIYAGIETYHKANGNTSCVAGRFYNVHTRTGHLTMSLPDANNARVGQQIGIVDHGGMADRNPIAIVASSNQIGGGRQLATINTSGGMYLFECRYQDTASTDVRVWMPVISPETIGLYLFEVDQTGYPFPNSIVPKMSAGTTYLPTNATNGDRVKIIEHVSGGFKTAQQTVRSQSGQEIMNVANGTFTIPKEVNSIEFIWQEAYNSWQIYDMSIRATSDGKLDLVTNLTWVRRTASTTAAANHGYIFDTDAMGGAAVTRTVTLPTTFDVGTVVMVSLEGENRVGHRVRIRGGSVIGNHSANSYPDLVKGGSSVELVYVGSSQWIEASRDVTHALINGLGSTPVLSFDEDANTFTKTLTSNFTLTSGNCRFPGGVCTTFMILLVQDGTGNRAINLPSNWKKSSGSEDFSMAPNTYNLIQGTHIQGVTFYNVSVYA